MYINTIYFEDNLLNITVEEVIFNELNLLVGASGAGKTMIINAISNLKQITMGNSGFPGVKWKIEFTTTSGNKISWSGETEKSTLPAKIVNDLNGNSNNNFISEEIKINGSLFAQRNFNNLVLNGDERSVPNDESILHEAMDAQIHEIKDEFDKIIFSDNSPQYDFNKGKFSISAPLVKSDKKFTLDEIKAANLSTPDKLYLAYKYVPEVFEQIKERFIEIFAFVKDVKIAPYKFPKNAMVAQIVVNHPVVQIKENHSGQWVHEIYISSGMSRTLLKLAEIELASSHSVIIIDELENSLGANSLEVLVDEIKYNDSDIQFIITSHHPYIIQNIEPDTWRLVKRNKNKITTLSAEKVGIGLSKHDRFFELLNTDEFRTGIKQ